MHSKRCASSRRGSWANCLILPLCFPLLLTRHYNNQCFFCIWITLWSKCCLRKIISWVLKCIHLRLHEKWSYRTSQYLNVIFSLCHFSLQQYEHDNRICIAKIKLFVVEMLYEQPTSFLIPYVKNKQNSIINTLF